MICGWLTRAITPSAGVQRGIRECRIRRPCANSQCRSGCEKGAQMCVDTGAGVRPCGGGWAFARPVPIRPEGRQWYGGWLGWVAMGRPKAMRVPVACDSVGPRPRRTLYQLAGEEEDARQIEVEQVDVAHGWG